MSDRSPTDDPLVSFDPPESSSVTTPTKQKSNNEVHENRSLEDIDPFGSNNNSNHNGAGNTNGEQYHEKDHHDGVGKKDNGFDHFSLNNDDLFPLDTSEQGKASVQSPVHDHHQQQHEFSTRKNEESEDSSLNILSHTNGNEDVLTDKNTLLLDLDPNAPAVVSVDTTPSPNVASKPFVDPLPQQQDKTPENTETLLDFGESTTNEGTVQQEQQWNLTSFNNPVFDHKPTSPSKSEQEQLVLSSSSDREEKEETSALHLASPVKEEEEKSLINQSEQKENVPSFFQANEMNQPNNTAEEERLFNEACEEVDNAANELAATIDLVSSPSPPATSGRQSPPSFPDTGATKAETAVEPASPTPVANVKTPTAAAEDHDNTQAALTAASPKLNSTLPVAPPSTAHTAASPSTATSAAAKKPATGIARPNNAAKPKPASATAASSSKTAEPKATAGAGSSKAAEPKAAASSTAAASSKHAPAASSKSTEPKAAASSTAAASTKPAEPKTAASSTAAASSKPAAAASSKSSEPKAPTTVRKPHSAPTASAAVPQKPKVTPPSPGAEPPAAAKSTRDAPAKPSATASASTKPKPAASSTATSGATRSTMKPTTTKPAARPTAAPKTPEPTSPDQQTLLSTAPEGATASPSSPAAATAGHPASKPAARPLQASAKPPTKTASGSGSSHLAASTAASRTGVTSSKTTVAKERPTSHNRATGTRAATSSSATVAPKRSNSASRPTTADAASRPARPAAAAAAASGEGASGTTDSNENTLIHRKVHANELPEYLATGASRQFVLHRTDRSSSSSPTESSSRLNDGSSEFFAIEQTDTPRKRHRDRDSELSRSKKRHVITERIIPVSHQRATMVNDTVQIPAKPPPSPVGPSLKRLAQQTGGVFYMENPDGSIRLATQQEIDYYDKSQQIWAPPVRLPPPAPVLPIVTARPLAPPPPVVLFEQPVMRPVLVRPPPPPPVIIRPPPPVIVRLPPPPQVIYTQPQPIPPPPYPTKVTVQEHVDIPPPPPPPAPLTTTEIIETVRTVRRRPRAAATETIIEQPIATQKQVIIEETQRPIRIDSAYYSEPQIEVEQVKVRRQSISEPEREILVEQRDTVVATEQLLQPVDVEVDTWQEEYRPSGGQVMIEQNIVESEPIIEIAPPPAPPKKKKIVARSKIDSWNRGYKPGGGNIKIYNKGLKFDADQEPIVDTFDRTYTKHSGVVQIQSNVEPPPPEETTIEVTTRPFEIEAVSRTVTVTREIKVPEPPPPPSPPTPPPVVQPTVIQLITPKPETPPKIIKFPIVYKRRLPPKVKPQTIIIQKPQIVKRKVEYKTVIEERPPPPPIIIPEYEESIRTASASSITSTIIVPPKPLPMLYFLAREQYLTELEFNRANTKQADHYSTEKARPSTYNFDYDRQYAAYISKQINEYYPPEEVLDYDPTLLSFRQLRSSIDNFDYERQYAAFESKQFHEYHPPEQILDYNPTHISLRQLRPDIDDFHFEQQYAAYETNQFSEYHRPEETLAYDPSQVSLQMLRSKTYDLDFERQYAMYNSGQFEEFHPPERTLDYDPTRLSLQHASPQSIEYLLLNRALHAVHEYVDETIRYSLTSPFADRVRPRSVTLPLTQASHRIHVRHRVLSEEPPPIHWRRPPSITVDRREILKIISKKMIRKRIAWERIRQARARIDCWNRDYRRPPLVRPRLKQSKIFYQPKPYDTWNEEGQTPTSTPRRIHSRIERVEAKPRIDSWLRKSYPEHASTFKIFNKPVQIQGKSRIDSWMPPTYRARSTSARIINRPIQITGKSKIDSWLRPPIRKAQSAMAIVHKPMHIIGRSRIDTWRKYPLQETSHFQRILHRPIQVQGKSRVDSWLRRGPPRQVRSMLEIHKPLVIHARSRIDTWQKQQLHERSQIQKVLHRPIQIEAKSRVDSWLRPPLRRAHSGGDVVKIYDKPLHIIGRSRVDTWQRYRSETRSDVSKVVHKPIQITGKSRVDSWLRAPMRRTGPSTAIEIHKPMQILARSRIDTWQKQPLRSKSHVEKILHRPIQIQGKSRIDSWLRRSAAAESQGPSSREIHKPLIIHARSRIDTWQKQQWSSPENKHRIIHRPIQVQGKSRIDTWQSTFRRQARSADETIISRPMHIIGQSRIDTWQKQRPLFRQRKNRIIHRPIQIQGKSRIDTWSKRRQRSHSAIEIHHRPLPVFNARSRIDTWQGESMQRRRVRSASEDKKPVHVIGRSRVDTWNHSLAVAADNRFQLIHRPMHVHAHAIIDTWQSVERRSARHWRARSVPVIGQHIASRSRIDTWGTTVRARSATNVRSLLHKPLHVQARSKIDTWSQAGIQRTHGSRLHRSMMLIKTEAKPRVDSWLPAKHRAEPSTIEIFHKPVHVNSRPQVDSWLQTSVKQDGKIFRTPLDRPVQIDARSRIDTWRRKETSAVAIKSISKSIHLPMHVHAHSKIDSWTTTEDMSRAARTIRKIDHNPIHTTGQAKIDTWSTILHGRVEKKKPTRTRPVYVAARSQVDSWQTIIRQSSAPLSSKSMPSNFPVHVQAHTKVNTWNVNQPRNTIRSKSFFVNRPVDISQVKSSIDTWNEEYQQQSKSTIEVLHKPIHVEARSKINTFRSTIEHRSNSERRQQQQQTISSKKRFFDSKSRVDSWRDVVDRDQDSQQKKITHPKSTLRYSPRSHLDCWNRNSSPVEETNISIPKSQRVHMEAKSMINTWRNNNQTMTRRRHRSASFGKMMHINGQAKVDTWQTIERRRSISTFDLTRQQQPVFVDAKATIDSWRNTENFVDHQQTNVLDRPIHIDARAQVDSWSQIVTSRRASTGAILKPIMIDFDHAKSTIDTWNTQVDSLSRSRVVDGKSSIDTWQKPARRVRPKFLKTPESSIIREEGSQLTLQPTTAISEANQKISRRRMHFQPVSQVDCWNWSFQPAARRTFVWSNYQILPPIHGTPSEQNDDRLVASGKAQSKIGSLQNTTHKAGGGAVKKSTPVRENSLRSNPSSPISNQKLQWNAKSKIGSLENARHKPGGGSVKIESKKLDFKEKAKPKTDTGVHETMTSGATGTEEQQQQQGGETNDEILESPRNDDGDTQNK